MTFSVVPAGGRLNITNLDSNTGNLIVDNNSIVNITGDYTQTDGIINLQGGNLDITGIADIKNGSLVGTGTLTTNTLINDSLINPGNSIGTLNLNGNYTQTTDGILNIELGGTNVGEFDQLVISNNANLNGTLNISLVNDYIPTIGDSFEIITYGSRLNDFTTPNLPTLSNGLSWKRQFDADSLTLTVM